MTLKREAVLAIAVLLSLGAPASAASLGAVDRHISRTDFDAAIAEAQSLAVGGALAWVPAYVRGYAHLRRGEIEQAEEIARRLLADDPGRFRVRHLLINVLLAGGQHQAAMFHINRNLVRTRNPAVRKQYAELIANYDEANPKSGISLSMSANPSSNITRGTGVETIYLNGLPFVVGESSRARSGTTVAAGLTAYRRFALGERSNVVVSGTATLEKDVEQRSKDILTLAPRVQFVHRLGETLLSAGPIAEIQWRDYRPLAHRVGGTAAVYHPLTNRTSVQLTTRALAQTYPEFGYLDGYKLEFNASLQHELTPSLIVTGGFGIEREKTEAAHLTYDLREIDFGLRKQWSNGFYADVSLSYGQKLYADSTSLSASGFRKDNRFEVQIGVAHERLSLFGITPYVGYRYTRNDSNVSLYTFESNDLIISARKKF